MGKILDSEFRNGLYKSLVEAGYDKEEAKVIVGKKFYVELKTDICETLKAVAKAVDDDKPTEAPDLDKVKESIAELIKLEAILNPKPKATEAK